MDLMIGCPVAKREWILPRWMEYIEHVMVAKSIDPLYAFAIDADHHVIGPSAFQKGCSRPDSCHDCTH